VPPAKSTRGQDLQLAQAEHRDDFLERIACSCRLAVAVDASSASDEFCCVVSSIRVTARFTCSMPLDCSSLAVVMSPMMRVTRWMLATISSIVSPASPTRRPPDSTEPTESPISALISRAAPALRCASERTSLATTAKPRPCSPARAASTAAFSARMFVWNAIASMTPMMSAILRELRVISSIFSTTSCITSPPRAATFEARRRARSPGARCARSASPCW
jgi:hypothetical protein